MSFYSQFEKLCARDGVRPGPLLESLGMSKGNMGRWQKGQLPSGTCLVQICEHFNVSADYLLFGKETDNTLSEEESEFITRLRALPPGKRGEVKGYLNRILEEECSTSTSVAADDREDLAPEIAAK